ncbi:hypothetical protein [Falsihalocynthiibacter arcticus]
MPSLQMVLGAVGRKFDCLGGVDFLCRPAILVLLYTHRLQRIE